MSRMIKTNHIKWHLFIYTLFFTAIQPVFVLANMLPAAIGALCRSTSMLSLTASWLSRNIIGAFLTLFVLGAQIAIAADTPVINDAPVNSVPGAQAVDEDDVLLFSAGNGNQIQITDVDAASAAVQVSLAVTHGTLTLAGTTGLSFTYGDGTADASMVFTGTVAAINIALATLPYNPIADYNGSATLTLITNDQGNTGTGGAKSDTDNVSITINNINDAPIAHDDLASTLPGAPIDVVAQANDIDIDNIPGDITFTILSNSVGTAATVNPDNTINFDPGATIDVQTVTYQLTDPDGLQSGVATLTINVAANNPPTSLDALVTFDEDTSYSFQASDFAFNDADGGQTLANVRIATLPASGTLSLSGIAVRAGQTITTANITNLLFTPATNANGTPYTTFTFSVQDSKGGYDTSPNTIAVNVTAFNDEPVIANLNADTVAWAGVSNTVTLDNGGNASLTDTELGALNGGNGDWSGASLAIQRSGTAISADIFAFTTGGLFSVSGNTLQSSGQTFATFTNTGSVLTINFNSAMAPATTALVNDVARHISYRNDTPSGDTTIRFTLSDGAASTTADVTVTSDSIYVTNTTDTATINVATGVSFSEAVAIAAADVTGSQTIVFSSSLASTALSINSVTLNESLTFDMDAASGMSLTTGIITLSAATTQTFTNGTGDSATIASAIAGAGALNKAGAGALSLTGSNSYAGTTVISDGTLSVAGDGNLGSGAITLAAGTIFRVTGSSTIDNAIALSGNASVDVANTVNFDGVVSGSYRLTKTGVGTLTLHGTNAYNGTTVSAGTLSIAGDSNLGYDALTLASGTTLEITGAGTIDNPIALTGAATISNSANATVDGVISGAYNLTKAGSGVLTLANNNTYAATSIAAGTLSVSSDNNLGSDAITLAAGTTLAINGATTIDNAIALTGAATISNTANATIDGVISGANTLTKSGASTLTLSNTNTYSGTTVSAGILSVAGDNNLGSGAITLADGTRLNITSATTIDNAIIILSGVATVFNDPGSATVTLSGVISGSGGLTKGGRATLTLSASNTYTGATLVSTGTLTVGHNNALGDTAGGTTVNGVGTNGASLRLSDGVTTAENFVIAGTGGPGNNGTLRVISGSATLTGTVTLTAESYIRADTGANLTVSGVVSGAFNLRSMGTGTLTLLGDNTYSGGTTLSRSTLSVASGSNLGTGTVTMLDGSTLMVTGTTTIANAIALNSTGINDTHTVNNANPVTLSGNITGTLPLTKAGGGVLTLSGTNSYSGTTTVSVGTLSVTGSTAGATTVASGATLGGTGTLGGTVTVQNGGTLAPGNSAGTLTLNGNLTMASGSTLAVEINGTTAGTDYDQVIVSGTVAIAGTLSATHGYTAGQGDSYTIIVNDMADAITGTFSGVAEGATTTAGGNSTVLTASYIGGTGNDFTLAAPLNSAPVTTNLNGDSVSFIEDSDLVLLDANSDATVTDSDSVDFDGGNVTVSIINNRVNTEDVLSIRNEGTSGGQIGTSGLNVTYGGTIIGTRTATGGTDNEDLVITLNSAATPAIIQALVRNLTYINTNTTEPTTYIRSVEVTVNDGDGGTSNGATIDVAVVALNDAPTLTATGGTPTFTEGGSAVDLYSTVAISTVETGQTLNFLTLKVTNVSDINAEILSVDGTDITLFGGTSGTTATNGMAYSVSSIGTTATVSLSKLIGLNAAAMETLVDGISYRNTSHPPTTVNRVVTLTELTDSGGTANSGQNTATLAVAATVNIEALNSAPVINGAPPTRVNRGGAYSFTPTASDVDTGTVLTYSINNKPSWAVFNTSTGALTGIPSSADVGITNGIVISVSDGALTASLPAFNLTVVNVNNTPVINGSSALTVDQDTAYAFLPMSSDPDGDSLTFTIVNKPAWASFSTATGGLSGTPTKSHVGVTNGIVISVSDGMLSTSLPAFNLTVVSKNEAPVIGGSPAVSVNQETAYTFVPTSSDANGDTLTFTIANQPSWASFDTSTGALSGTPRKTDVGTTTGILISVSDGMLSTSLPVFAIEVVSATDPLQPIVTAPADLDVNATGLYTPISLRQLLSLSSSASQADIDQTLKSLASNGVSGNDCCTTHPEGLTDANNLLLRPGHHEVKWKATNASGMTGEATQVVNIRPIVSLSKSQIAVRGSTVEFRVILNGASPQYPLSIPYAIDAASSATAAEHNLSSGTATFTQEGQLAVPIAVQLAAVTGFSDSQLIITLGAGINAGSANRHTIDIREGNVPPVVTMDIRQGGLSTSLITPTGGPVTINLTVTDANKGDTHTFDWSATTGLADTDGNLTNDSRTFDPAGLTGSHQVQVTTTDSAGASVQTQAYFRVVTTLPTLSETADTDKDGLSDALEGTGDDDGNGIPDYLDNMPSSNILPQTGNVTNAYLIECDPGVRCGLGLFALSSTSGGVQILNTEVNQLANLKADPMFEPVGGIFDFVIRDLPVAGQSVRVVIPQRALIPANAVYRKFQKGEWVSFISNTNNALHSTAGNPGYCPPPGSTEWTPGLTQGHLCVQLTLEDGGPNDADGLVNAAVIDPGAVSTALPVVPPVQPPAEPPEVEVKAKRGGAMGEVLLLLLAGLLFLNRSNSKGWIITLKKTLNLA